MMRGMGSGRAGMGAAGSGRGGRGAGRGRGRGIVASPPTKLRRSLFPPAAAAAAASASVGEGQAREEAALEVVAAGPSNVPPTFEAHPSSPHGEEEEEELALELEDIEGMAEQVMEGLEGKFVLVSPKSSAGSPHSTHAAEDVGASAPPTAQCVAPRSVVWDHFEVQAEDPTLARCNHCRMRLSRGKDVKHLTTSSLLAHLRRHHPLQIGAPPRKSPAKKDPAPCPAPERPQRQSTMEEWSQGRGTGSGRGRRGTPSMREITQRIGEMLALDDQPFLMVEQEGFHRLMVLVALHYEIPSCTTFSHTVVPSLFAGCRELL